MTDPPHRPPVIICTDDPRRSSRALGSTYRPQDGLELPDHPWDLADRRLACTIDVTTSDDARRTVEAVSRGVAVIARIGLAGLERHHLLEDLHRVGSVHMGEPLRADPFALISAADRTMIEALAAGGTVTSVASTMHLSRRTANRRLADLRQALGLDTTAEVLALWVRRHR